MKTNIWILIVLLGGGVVAWASAGWRTDGTGRYPDAKPKVQWDEKTNVAWRADLGAWSNATPLVVGDRVFVQVERTGIVCVNAADGKTLWRDDLGYDKLDVKMNLPRTHDDNGYSTPTPATDGSRIYVAFGTGVVACYDLEGNRRWARFLEQPKAGWGHSSSPVVVDGKVLIGITQLFALDAEDGAEAWKAAVAASWGTPAIAKIGNESVAFMPTGQAVRVRNGKILATLPSKLEYNSPVIADGMIFYISGASAAYRLPEAIVGEKIDVAQAWRAELPRERYYASPLVHDGRIYAVTRGGELSVLDAATGKSLHSRRLIPDGRAGDNNIYSSVTLAGEHILIGSARGVTYVLKSNATADLVGENRTEGYRGCPVFVGDTMYLRAGRFLYRIE